MNETWEIIGSIALRATVIYLALLVLLRIGGRRELAQLTPADMLLLLLLSEAVSPALSGGRDSLGAGLLSAAVLVGLTFFIGWLTFRSPRFEAIVEGNPLVLVKDGRIDVKRLRGMRITDQQLRTFLHEHGLLRVDQVAVAYVEPSGRVTIIKEDERPAPRAQPSALPAFDETASIAEIKSKLEELEQALQRKKTSERQRRAP